MKSITLAPFNFGSTYISNHRYNKYPSYNYIWKVIQA